MNTEYESLRDEIKAWQERRFTVLAGSIALVTGILGLKIVGESDSSSNWTWVSSLLLAMLAASCAITWYSARANAKIAAYLMVFHEATRPQANGWESRLKALKDSGHDDWHLNHIMVPIYVALGCLAVFVPLLSHLKHSLGGWDVVSLAVTGTLFVFTLMLLRQEPPREHYRSLWIDVQKDETKKQNAAKHLT